MIFYSERNEFSRQGVKILKIIIKMIIINKRNKDGNGMSELIIKGKNNLTRKRKRIAIRGDRTLDHTVKSRALYRLS